MCCCELILKVEASVERDQGETHLLNSISPRVEIQL